MTFFLTVIAFLVIFSALVLIHEWGHFIVARKAGIKVEEFGFGLPPRIWGKKKGETLYSINLIPFGGFVKLLGEDSHDPKALKDKRSFISKSPRIRIMVVLAGVFMNFFLAMVLLTIGFTFGIQPMILSGDDVLENLNNGNIHVQQGIVIKEVVTGGGAEKAGLQTGDVLLSADGREILSIDELTEEAKRNVGKPIIFEVARDQQRQSFQITPDEKNDFGFKAYEIVRLPRVVVSDIPIDSAPANAGLKPGDILLSINGKPIYFVDDLEEAVSSGEQLQFTVFRDNRTENLIVPVTQPERIIITDVLPDSRAEKAGFQKGDIIVRVNETVVLTPQQLVGITDELSGQDIVYEVRRDESLVPVTVQPDQDGLIGVWLSAIVPHENIEFSYYPKDFPVSVVKIENIRYPFWIAPLRALEESGRLSVLTVEMFGNVIKSVFTRFVVPEGVAGPVGIAQLTYVFVQEGLLSLLRFMALLSLSLAIINVLPFPALDGGRLLFILVEVIIGRKVGQKFEAVVHAVGFIILMLLIFAVTYSDILKLF